MPGEDAIPERTPQKYDIYSDVVDLAWIDGWQASLGGNKNTSSAYLSGLIAFLSYLQNRRLRLTTVKRFAVEEFSSMLKRLDYKPATISLYLAGVRSFYRYLELAYDIDNVAEKVQGAKADRSHKKDALPREMAQELLASIETETLAGNRDFAIVNLMVRVGLRDIEVSRALVGDISHQGEKAILAVQGKGRSSKDQYVVLPEAALDPIRKYLIARGNKSESEPLFTSLSDRNLGKALTANSISRIVKNRFRAIGIDDARYTAHSLRHTAVTYSLLGGATVQEAQAMARHGDISTTMIYAHNVARLESPAEEKASGYLDELL